jgi:hypothetical protein
MHFGLISLMGYSFYKVGRSEGIEETLTYLHEQEYLTFEDEN